MARKIPTHKMAQAAALDKVATSAKARRKLTHKQAEAAALAKAQKKQSAADGLSIIEHLRQRRSLMSVPEFALLTDEKPCSVYKKAREGRLPHIRLGYIVKLDPIVMADFLEACTIEPAGTIARATRSRAQAENSARAQRITEHVA